MADRMQRKKKIINRPPDLMPVGTHSKINKPDTSYLNHYPTYVNSKPNKNHIPDHLVAKGVTYDKPKRNKLAQYKNAKNWLPTKPRTTDDIKNARPFPVPQQTQYRERYVRKDNNYWDRRNYTPDHYRTYDNKEKVADKTTNKQLHDKKSINYQREKEIFRINKWNDRRSHNLMNDGTRPLDTEYKMEYTEIQRVNKMRKNKPEARPQRPILG